MKRTKFDNYNQYFNRLELLNQWLLSLNNAIIIGLIR